MMNKFVHILIITRQNSFDWIKYFIKTNALYFYIYMIACLDLKRLHHVTFFTHVHNFFNIIMILKSFDTGNHVSCVCGSHASHSFGTGRTGGSLVLNGTSLRNDSYPLNLNSLQIRQTVDVQGSILF